MTVLSAEAHPAIIEAVQKHVGTVLIDHEKGIRSSEVIVTMVPINKDAHRLLYCIEKPTLGDGRWNICPIQDATHFLLVDMEYGVMVKGECFTKSDISAKLYDWVQTKHVRTILVYCHAYIVDNVENARSPYLETHGIVLP